MIRFVMFLFGLLVVVAQPEQLIAQTLDQLLSSEAYRDFKRDVQRSTSIKEGYANGSEYLNLFSRGKMGIKPLLDWIGSGSGEFKRGKTELKSNKGFIEANALFNILNSASNESIKVTIYVPKPASVAASSWGLFRQFRELEPPILEIDQKETLDINSLEATLFYHRKEGACSLLFKISKGVLVNLYTKSCANREPLINLGRSLDIRRLNQKLNS